MEKAISFDNERTTPKGRVLLLDPRSGHCELLTFLLSEEGFAVDVASDAALAREFMERSECAPSLIIADIQLPYGQGGAIVAELRQKWADVPIYLLVPQVQPVPSNIERHVTALIRKPFAPEDLLRKIASKIATPSNFVKEFFAA